jgi:hypothetical protein
MQEKFILQKKNEDDDDVWNFEGNFTTYKSMKDFIEEKYNILIQEHTLRNILLHSENECKRKFIHPSTSEILKKFKVIRIKLNI